MFSHLPVAPQTRITQQLECVSCRHIFTISEDDALLEGIRSQNWRFPPDRTPDTQLRYQPDRSRRLVITEPPAKSNRNLKAYQKWDDARRDQINCPRCGADNRNWLRILNPPTQHHIEAFTQWRRSRSAAILSALLVAFGAALIFGSVMLPLFENAPPQWGGALIALGAVLLLALILIRWAPAPFIIRRWQWQQRFGIAPYGLLLTIGFVGLAYHFHFGSTPDAISRSLTLLLVVFLAGLAPTLAMTGAWNRLREYKSTRQVVPPTSFFDFSPPIRAWIWLTALFLFILPLFLYVLVPSAFYLFSTALEKKDPPAEPTLEQGINNARGELEQKIDDTAANLENIIATAELSVSPSSNEEPAANKKEELPPWVSADNTFLRAWFKYVLMSSLAALVFSLIAVNRYAGRINRHLPRHIFHSIAHMTRVVVWEAGAALEIEDEVHLIQWTHVRRNEAGGIVLEGVYRDAVPPGQPDESLQARVRAQRYEISADKWGHIRSAQLTAVRVPVRPRLPGLPDAREKAAIPNAFFRTALPVRSAPGGSP